MKSKSWSTNVEDEIEKKSLNTKGSKTKKNSNQENKKKWI